MKDEPPSAERRVSTPNESRPAAKAMAPFDGNTSKSLGAAQLGGEIDDGAWHR